jgi:hypothetical protein
MRDWLAAAHAPFVGRQLGFYPRCPQPRWARQPGMPQAGRPAGFWAVGCSAGAALAAAGLRRGGRRSAGGPWRVGAAGAPGAAQQPGPQGHAVAVARICGGALHGHTPPGWH